MSRRGAESGAGPPVLW